MALNVIAIIPHGNQGPIYVKLWSMAWQRKGTYYYQLCIDISNRQISNIRRSLVGNTLVDHSGVAEAYSLQT